MMERIRISSHLVRIARMLIIANIVDDFKAAMLKADPSIDTMTLDEMSEFVKFCSAKPKIRKLASHCLVNGFLKWPGGKGDFDAVVRLFELIRELNQGMIRNESDYDKLVHPSNYPNDPECKRYVKLLYDQDAHQERATGGFNPDVEFKGGKYTDGVVTIYMLNETPDEMQRVRRALDVAYGMDRNPWCLAARVKKRDPSFEPGSKNFEGAWRMWKYYSDGPKRIAFTSGKPAAFYADGLWWDMKDKSNINLPIQGATDDRKFIDRIEKPWDSVKKAEKGHLTDDEMIELAEDDDEEVIKALVKRKDLPEEVIRKLAGDDNKDVRFNIARRKKLPADVIRLLAEDMDFDVTCSISERKNLPVDVIRLLAGNKYGMIRKVVAKNKRLPDDLLIRLAGDNDECVRIAIAERNDLSDDLLIRLAGDNDEYVRRAIAKKEDLPEDLFRNLAHDRDNVREALAGNDGLPADLLRQLANDDSMLVRYIVAKRKDLPNDVIRLLAKDKNTEVRRTIAVRKDIPANVIRILAKDNAEYVRRTIALRKVLPADVIRLLAKDGDFLVRRIIKNHH